MASGEVRLRSFLSFLLGQKLTHANAGTFVSAVKLIFKIDGLSITGQGQGTHECPERWMVRKYARKKAVTDAMKCAWNAVCIVLLPGGKRTIHLLPRSLNYWMANTGDNTDDTNFEQPVDESVQR